MPKLLNEYAVRELIEAPRPKNLQFRSFMMKLGKQFKSDDLSDMKYALRETIPAGKMENLRTPLDVFVELEERNMVGLGKLDELRDLLEAIERPHMIAMVDEFDDSSSAFPLKPKSENYLEMDGCRLAIKGGRHFQTTEGEFVEVRSGANYALTITNLNNHRCICNVKIDGYEMFTGGLRLNTKQEWTIERPSREKKKFKFFAIADAPEGSGINKWRREQNGIVQVIFIPERDDMRITCVAKGSTTHVLSCSDQTTDSDFVKMVLSAFGVVNATIMVNTWKPLSKRGVKLTEYGIRDGSQVYVNVGGSGGVSFNALSSIQNTTVSKKNVKWRAGATTLEDESQQRFVSRDSYPQDPTLAVSLNLRLVAREDKRPLPSTGQSTPLARATLIPPPVPT